MINVKKLIMKIIFFMKIIKKVIIYFKVLCKQLMKACKEIKLHEKNDFIFFLCLLSLLQ